MCGDDAVTEFQEGLITFRNSAGSKSSKNNHGTFFFEILFLFLFLFLLLLLYSSVL